MTVLQTDTTTQKTCGPSSGTASTSANAMAAISRGIWASRKREVDEAEVRETMSGLKGIPLKRLEKE